MFDRQGEFPVSVGAAVGGRIPVASMTVAHPDLGKDWSLFTYNFDWKDVLNSILGPPGVGNVDLSGRKEMKNWWILGRGAAELVVESAVSSGTVFLPQVMRVFEKLGR
jgi:hypothetical protein